MILSASGDGVKPKLRPYLPKDLAILTRILRASIEELTGDDYTEGQIAAWVDSFADETALASRLESGLTLIATLDGLPAGFAVLKGKDEIDLLYVAPGVVRRGVATALIDALEKLASARGAPSLKVAASDTARPFFSARGYEPQSRNTVTLGDEWLGHTIMSKALSGKVEPLH